MKSVWIIALLSGLLTGRLLAQSDELTYRAYLSGKDIRETKLLWEKAVASRQKEFDENPRSKQAGYRLALAEFGLLSSTLRDKDEALFDEHVDKTIALLEELCDADKNWGEPKALLGSVYGLQLSYSPWKGMFLGPKSGNLIEEALKASSDSPLAWKLYGNSKFFTPEMWGGDLAEAIKAYEKAILLYEANPASCQNNWLYLDTFAFLGQAYAKKNDTDKAISIFEKALQLEPSFDWIHYSLLPQVKGK